MQEHIITSYVGVEPLKFGMTRDEVHQIPGATPFTFCLVIHLSFGLSSRTAAYRRRSCTGVSSLRLRYDPAGLLSPNGQRV
ncbi:hypothetical protein E2K99_02445 [Herbaspirillum huttiense]|nr:hypothetical protein E2K99_02445 [Herbaspirillum huttiense]